MSAESPRHARAGGPLTVASQPPNDRTLIDAVSGFINDVTLSSSSTVDPKDVIQWARFEVTDINEPTPEGDSDNDNAPLLLILGYGSGVQVWLIPPNGEAQEVLSWRQGTVRVLRILPSPQRGDCFASKRPLIALCDSSGPGPAFCSLSFMSIRGGEQVKSIKFKNPILDVLANKRSVVVSFSERFAVFDAGSLEDRMAVTTCYPCPCPLGGPAPVNPLALGDRWLAYADKKLNVSKRSSGGCEGEGASSYTATVLHAAKSLSAGLRGLGETVAHSLAGRAASQSPSPPHDQPRPGLVTVLDLESVEEGDEEGSSEPYEPVVAHFVAHSDAIIALKFDDSGLLLVTADRRGHDFHVFRIHPHPLSPALASVHHLYILHRGDTTAKVQDIAISLDCRWAAVSTLRGTTHVFALSPYGGAPGVRTHAGPRVVNRLSRFHRSAGLPIHDQPHRESGEPGTALEAGGAGLWFPNPRAPPLPAPLTLPALAQLRPHNLPAITITRTSSGRQRLSSVSEEVAPLLARARWAPPPALPRAPPRAPPRAAPRAPPAPPPLAALYLVCSAGVLLHVVLRARLQRGVPKEKICDESPIEVEVEPIAQWTLTRNTSDLLAPLHPSNPLLQQAVYRRPAAEVEERWLSQVEIVTHAGPHRRLWMGPQFVFKTYNHTGSNSSLSEAETVEVDPAPRPGSNPVNMPTRPVLLDSGSSSVEHSPSDSFRRKSLLAAAGSVCDVQLKEDLAEAMKEDNGEVRRGDSRATVQRAVDPLGTVVAAAAPPAPPPAGPAPAPRPNVDEAGFRAVQRAPAPLPPPLTGARLLPRATTIPAQALPPAAPPPAAAAPLPLADTVTIPAALSRLAPYSPSTTDEEVSLYTRLQGAEDEYNLDSISYEESAPTLHRMPTPDPEPLDYTEPDVEIAIEIQPEQEVEVHYDPEPEPPKRELTPEPVPAPEVAPRKAKREKKYKEPIEKIELERSSPVRSIPEREPSVEVTVQLPLRRESTIEIPPPLPLAPPPTVPRVEIEIKTEEQAWDMLINDQPTHTAVITTQPTAMPDEAKIKSKRNRKSKKSPEDSIIRTDDDSFVEIHAIEDRQPASDELVSISSPYEEGSFIRSKKSRSPRSHTPEREKSPNKNYKELESSTKTCELNVNLGDFDTNEPCSTARPKLSFRESVSFDYRKLHPDGTSSETTSIIQKDSTAKSKKCKSLSPNPDETRKSDKSPNFDKDVYVIDTTNEDFPEIQITSGLKNRKKSPQPEWKTQVKEPEAPMKSWSSIAASRNQRKSEESEFVAKQETEDSESSEKNVIEEYRSSKNVSLSEKFASLYNRTDIVVAQCDEPTELAFVDEHLFHLAPLQSLNFPLDDFKLDAMRDSLLEHSDTTTSPICKINIDDILNTISTSRAESNTFNLVELEKVPARRERGFSVVEGHKITTQEVQLESPVDPRDGPDKSSDEDCTPVLSTDSDKEDKKASAVNAPLPSIKQTAKSKKSRRKKK